MTSFSSGGNSNDAKLKLLERRLTGDVLRISGVKVHPYSKQAYIRSSSVLIMFSNVRL
jgi:hypothetical protein